MSPDVCFILWMEHKAYFAFNGRVSKERCLEKKIVKGSLAIPLKRGVRLHIEHIGYNAKLFICHLPLYDGAYGRADAFRLKHPIY